MGIFDEAIDAMFDSDVAVDASYAPVSGSLIDPIRVVPSRDDALTNVMSTDIKSKRAVFELRTKEILAPKNGDVLTLKEDGSRYQVKSARRPDEDRMIWLIDCVPL